jgi:fumarylacetoacetate (FAA) hydrolase
MAERPPAARFARERRLVRRPEAGVDMTFDFARLIEHLTPTRRPRRWRHCRVRHRLELRSLAGSSCIAERRMLEMVEQGAPAHRSCVRRPRIEMSTGTAAAFGAIDQRVVPRADSRARIGE